MAAFITLVLCAFACVLRYFSLNTTWSQMLQDRVEISTPIDAWKRVTEGVFLHNNGINPFFGDLYHDTPLTLITFQYLQSKEGILRAVFVVFDVAAALALMNAATHISSFYMSRQELERKLYRYGENTDKILLDEMQLRKMKLFVLLIYLFNPYSLFTCLAQSMAVFRSFVLAVTFMFLSHGSRTFSCFFLAVATYQSCYSLMLIVPASMIITKSESKSFMKNTYTETINSVVKTIALFTCFMSLLLWASRAAMGSWDFVYSTYGFTLTVPDLKPNQGLFWYFFTEMFEHFRSFFLWVFQINVFVYTVPLAVRLKDDPYLLWYILVGIMTIFKSYPSLGDVGLCLSMFPIWGHLSRYMRNSFIMSCTLLCTTVLAPVLWHLWIYAGSANANFYFAVTLAFSTGLIFLVTDILYAHLRWRYDLHNGYKLKDSDGKPIQIALE